MLPIIARAGAVVAEAGAAAVESAAKLAERAIVTFESRSGGGGTDISQLGQEAHKSIENFVVGEMNHLAAEIYEDAKANTPVRSGNLKAGWTVTKANSMSDQPEVSNSVDYAVYVELDTNKTSGHYMLANAIAKVTK